VRDLLSVLDIERVTLVGHSLGGGIALQFAYQFPERIDRLILISSGGLGPELTPLLRGATLPGADTVISGLGHLPERLTRGIFAAASHLPRVIARQDVPSFAEGLRGLAGSRQRHAFIRTARAVIDWRGQTVAATRHLGLLTGLPVLVAWGTSDKIIPPRHHLAVARHLPAPHIVEIPGAGHYPHETAPDQLLPALDAFLGSTVPFQYDESRWRELLTQDPDQTGGR
jgi:pimeloyl-ACP methyl ester carboxylesterase